MQLLEDDYLGGLDRAVAARFVSGIWRLYSCQPVDPQRISNCRDRAGRKEGLTLDKIDRQKLQEWLADQAKPQ